MAGMLPGIEMHRRRKTYSQRFHEDNNTLFHGITSHRSRLESSMEATTPATMDRAALIARRRLEEKLGCFRHPLRLNEGRGNQIAMSTRDNNNSEEHHLVSRFLVRPWHFQLTTTTNKSKGQGQGQLTCVVCMEDFRGEKQEVMELPCSHKYHSKCLLPWLADHPSCPSCRSPVQSSY